MENDQITSVLTIALVGLIVVLIILLFIYFMLIIKKKKSKKKHNKENNNNDSDFDNKNENDTDGKKSIMDFMNFYTIQDDMIIQKKSKKFLMVLQCQGINYDLMSDLEKNSVEAGFVQFLNTLNCPIQLYIQTRKVNLTTSIDTYKKKLKQSEEKLIKIQYQYNTMKKNPDADEKQLNKLLFELTKQSNLYEYTKDIIKNTEVMSLNKNILSKQYYIVVSYSPEGDETHLMNDDEITERAFSELYTRTQSISRVLNVCDVNSKILNSIELSELLYVAYNRDESDIFGIERAMAADYDSLYITAPDVLDKKKKNLDKIIEKKALELANNTVNNIKSKKEKEIEEKENNLDELIKQMAKAIVQQNERSLGKDVTDAAIEEINSSENKEEV